MEDCETEETNISAGEFSEEVQLITDRPNSSKTTSDNLVYNGLVDYDKHLMNHSVTVRSIKVESKSFGSLDGFSGFMQDSQDSPTQQVALQQKLNGGISRRAQYGATAGKHALRQQARRRRRNTSIASGNSPPITRVTMKSASSAACSPSGLSPSAQSSVGSSQSQCSPQLKPKLLDLSSSPCHEISQSEHKEEDSLTDNMARILANKLNPIIYDKNSVDNRPLNESPNELNSLVESCKGHQSPNFGSKVSPQSSGIRTSSRLMSINSSSQQAGFSSNSPNCHQTASRTMRVSVPQSSPSTRDTSSSSMTTMQSILASIPGFKPRKRSQRKLSTAAQLAQTKEGSIDLETSDSILVNVNLKSLVNADTYSSLPPDYQHRLAQLLPRVDQITTEDNSFKVSPTSFHNEFLARACVSWRERLREGEFTHENQVKLKGEAEKEKSKLDPWKVAHFEPVWGMKPCYSTDSKSTTSISMYEESSCGLLDPSPSRSAHYFSQLRKVVGFIASRDERREQRRQVKRLQEEETEVRSSSTSPAREFLLSSVDSDVVEIREEEEEEEKEEEEEEEEEEEKPLKRKGSPEMSESLAKRRCSAEPSPASSVELSPQKEEIVTPLPEEEVAPESEMILDEAPVVVVPSPLLEEPLTPPMPSPQAAPVVSTPPRVLSPPAPHLSPKGSPLNVVIKSPFNETPVKRSLPSPGYGSPVTLRISKARSQGNVNLQRSYEIVQGVIANSPNREQLQAQLKPPTTVLLHSPSRGDVIKVVEQKSPEKEVFLPPAQFMAPQGIPSSSIQPQTLTVVKSVPNGQTTFGKILAPGQRVFRSVALPLSALRSVTPHQMGAEQATSIAQKSSLSSGTPITILRNTAGGKHVILRTVSVSNIHLVRVSDILNSARGVTEGGEQQPPRASSAPPSRNDLVTYVPRPNSVGARIVIPSPSQIPSSSPSPNLHFLSEGDPSSGASDDAARAGVATPTHPQQYIIIKPNSVISTAASQDEASPPRAVQTNETSCSSSVGPGSASLEQRLMLVRQAMVPDDTLTNNNDASEDDDADEGCPCNMRAMVACVKCGAFCHHDCVSPSRLCVTCLIR